MDDKLDNNLNEDKNIEEIKDKKISRKKIIIIIIIISIILIIALLLILYFTLLKDEINDKEEQKSGVTFIQNISYVNTIIINSFKKGGENYIADLGEINNGEDYEKNEQNFYDIYFPEKKNINLSKPIILMHHGGAWIRANKEILSDFCKILAENGYISATMGYTLLGQNGTKSNIFRTIDETNYVISSIKNILKNMNYDEKKLKIVLAGES